MIPLLFNGRNGLIDVYLYSIYNTANCESDDTNVVRQLLFTYMCQDSTKRRAGIPRKLQEFLDDLDSANNGELSDNEYRGFSQGGYDFAPCSDSVGDLIPFLLTELQKRPEMLSLAKEFYSIRQCAEMLDIVVPDAGLIINAHNFYKNYDACKKKYASIKLDKFHYLINEGNSLSTEDIEKFAGYIALKYILRRDKVGRTDRLHVAALMAGFYDKIKDVDVMEYLQTEEQKKIFKRFSDKENFRKLIDRLRGGYFKFIQTVPGQNKLGLFFAENPKISVKEFNEAIEEIVIADRKQYQRDKKRILRKRKRAGCQKPNPDVCVTYNVTAPIEKVPEPQQTFVPAPDELSDYSFNECWVAYGRKGNEAKAKEEWERLTLDERNNVMPHITAYTESRDRMYQKDFERYLREKTFMTIVFKGNHEIYNPDDVSDSIITSESDNNVIHWQ